MQFLVYGVGQASGNTTPEMMAELGTFMEEAGKAGILITTGPVSPSGRRVRLSEGQITEGEVASIKLQELVGGFAVIRAASMEEATEWSRRFRKIIGEGETEIAQILYAE